MVLAMTHEEIVTTHVRAGRALLPRPAADPLPLPDQGARRAAPARRRAAHARVHHEGLLHVRPRRAGLDVGYEKHREAYDRIFDRCGLEWYRVESDVGMMGGIGAHEYMAPCPAGENDVALSRRATRPTSRWRRADAAAGRRCPRRSTRPSEVDTPGATTVEQVAEHARRARGRADQGLPGHRRRGRGRVLVLVRGDHRVNEIKLAQRARRAVPAGAARTSSRERIGARGLHRAGRRRRADPARRGAARARGLRHRRQRARRAPARRRAGPRLRVRARSTCARVEAGRHRSTGTAIRIEPAIEVGNIFKLGTRYSEPLGATYLDENGNEQLDLDGLLRHRPGAHRRRRGRAVRRREGHLLAALARAVRRRSSSALGKAGEPRSASWPSGSTTSCARPAWTSLYDDRTLGAGREVRRRRAARLPAAADGRQARRSRPARSRRRSGAGARRARCRSRARPQAAAELWRDAPLDAS